MNLNDNAIGEISARGDALHLSMKSVRKILSYLTSQLAQRDKTIEDLEQQLRNNAEVLASSSARLRAEMEEKERLRASLDITKAAVADLEREMNMWKRRVDTAESSQSTTMSHLEQTRRDFDLLSKELAGLKAQENDKAQAIVLSMQGPVREEMEALRRRCEGLRRECADVEQMRLEALQRASEDASQLARRQLEQECGALVPAGEVVAERRRVAHLQEDLHVAHLTNMRLMQLIASIDCSSSSSPLAEFTNAVLRDAKHGLFTLMGNEGCDNCKEDMRLGGCACGKRAPTAPSINTHVFISPSACNTTALVPSDTRWRGTGIPATGLYSGAYHNPQKKTTRTPNQLLRNAQFDGNSYIEAVSTSISRRQAEMALQRSGNSKYPRVNEADLALVSDATLQQMKYFASRGLAVVTSNAGVSATSKRQPATQHALKGGPNVALTNEGITWLHSLVDVKTEADYWIPHAAFVAAQSWRDRTLASWRERHGDSMYVSVAEHLSAERFFPLFLALNKVWRARTQEKRSGAWAGTTHRPACDLPAPAADEEDPRILWQTVQETLRGTISANSSTMRVASMYDHVVSSCLRSLDKERKHRRRLQSKYDTVLSSEAAAEAAYLRDQLDRLRAVVVGEGDDLRKSMESTCLDVHHFLDVAEDSLLGGTRRVGAPDDGVVAGFGKVLAFVREFVDEVANSTKRAAARLHKQANRVSTAVPLEDERIDG